MARLTYLTQLILVGIVAFSSSAIAQDRGDRNDDRNRRRGSWDPSEYLERLDANKNGQMDPGELRGRLADYVRDMGFSTEQPILISDIVNKATGREKKSSNSQQPRKREIVRKVPGFGIEAKEIDPVRNFSSDGSISNPEILARKYGDSLMSEVERTLERYDGNRNGKLDAEEIKRGNWGRPRPDESDLNKDGQLSKYELAERYKQRHSAQNDDNRDSRRDRGDRGDRGDDRRGDRRGDNRGSSRGDSRRDNSRRESGDSSDARAKARAAAEQAAKERAREEKMKEDDRERNDSRDSAARARAKAAAEAARRQRDSGSGDRRSSSDDRNEDRNDDRNENRDETYRAYAQKMIDRYDKNKDKVLSKDEMESFRRPPENHDPNEDGEVTFDELYQAYKNRSSNRGSSDSSSSGSSSRRGSSDRERTSESSRNRSSSSASDKDGDGRIKMVEFADEWTQEKIDEFKRLDVNNDGFLSRDEFRKR